MLKLLVLADDMTGTLDTAIKFVDAGVRTLVTANIHYGFRDENTDVLVMNTTTRHMTAEQAYRTVFDITCKAVEAGVPYLYKKVDSALRGNIGAELSAMLDASGQNQLTFLPAFPQMGRVTVDGVQWVDGKPVHESVFGSDPFEAVSYSYIPDIIAQQSQVQTTVVPAGQTTDVQGVNVYDCVSDEDMKQTAKLLMENKRLHVMAGCAGFAAVLPEHLWFEKCERQRLFPEERLLVLCGSVNPITRNQIAFAQRNGFRRVLLQDAALADGISDNQVEQIRKVWQEEAPMIVVTSNDSLAEGDELSRARERVSENLSSLLACMLDDGFKATLLITGGDTLLAVLCRLGIESITPLWEIAPGAVYSTFQYHGKKHDLISKAGGFGTAEFFVEMNERLKAARREEICTH